MTIVLSIYKLNAVNNVNICSVVLRIAQTSVCLHTQLSQQTFIAPSVT